MAMKWGKDRVSAYYLSVAALFFFALPSLSSHLLSQLTVRQLCVSVNCWTLLVSRAPKQLTARTTILQVMGVEARQNYAHYRTRD